MYQHELLDLAVRRAGSDNQLSKKLKISRACVSAWRNGISVMTAEKTIQIAEMAGVDPLVAIVGIELERAERIDSPTVFYWQKLARRVAGLSLAVILSLSNSSFNSTKMLVAASNEPVFCFLYYA